MRILRVAAILGLAVASACGSSDDASSTTDTSPSVTATAPAEPTTSTDSPATDPATTATDPATKATDPATTDPASTEPATTDSAATDPASTDPVATTTTTTTTTAPAALVDVKLYFLRDEQLAIVHRDVAGPGVLRATLDALLAGPTADELAADLVTAVPSATTLLDVALADGTATVDLDADYESGGGTLSMTARVAQVVFTATQFDNVDQVVFRLDGKPVEFLGGEGIVLDGPQTRSTVERSLTGGVIVDTPWPGDTVSSPITVTGEGDVFEADFPIEVWADGVLITRTIAFAGAWGNWDDFEATIDVDAPPGPIELIAYDGGGCGDDPDCPPIVPKVIPLTLTD